jgi:drug/metabolite transporter (DMT)-like permease
MNALKPWQANGLLLIAAIIWGSAFVPQAWGAVDVAPFLFTGLRFFLGALVVAPFAWREWQQAVQPDAGTADAAHAKHHLWPIVGLGLLIFLGVVMQQIGLASTSVTNAGVLTALYVPLTPFLGWLIYRQRPHWMVWPCAAACLVGSWLLAGGGTLAISSGDWWVITSSIFWALHLLFVGRVANQAGGPFVLSFVQFAVCAIASLTVAVFTEPWVIAGLLKAAPSIAYTGFISVGIAYTLQVVGQRHAHSAHAAIILSSETLFAALFGAVFMGDRLNTLGVVGCGLILGSIVLVQFQPTRPTH